MLKRTAMRFNNFLSFIFIVLLLSRCGESADIAVSPDATGQGGSMTRFAINGNTLYVVDRSSIKVYNIANDQFSHIRNVDISPGMETIFARGEYLYLGAMDGMYIYSISNPEAPSFVFHYVHIASCDPVVVRGQRAYVTLRSGTECGGGVDLLQILDISNPHDPALIMSHQMQSPRGLGVQGDLLFVCEGDFGLRVFDISNELQIEQLTGIPNINAYDVIVREGHIIVTGEDGIFQYAFSGEGVLTLISKIPVNRQQL
jgi:hypothetical protein